jgi:tetratricopeptide (TPR) repeat protein
MIQAILSQRHPGVRFEVVNAAMTAINSHTVLPIARDCASADGDIWVIYMGNNEVVGPFGAGTVFGEQTPPLPMIRATLALKATGTGQLLDSLLAAFQKRSLGKGEWRGMEMFLDQQIRADDPRMKSVYRNFERNLADIIQTGQRSGAGIVVSTVAVNLRDCAPFASAHRKGLSEADTAQWAKLYQLGISAQREGRLDEATRQFQEAAKIDNAFAELRFRQGNCATALGQLQAAREHFLAARDLDTLRFRCDSELNALIRQAASKHVGEGVLLADSEEAFEQQVRDGLPESELFYEHVHPTFKGNYVLARTLAEQVEKLLPKAIAAQSAEPQSWPSEADCAQRLAWADWSRLAALDGILVRVTAPPFIAQANHDAQVRSIKSIMEQLSPALQSAGIAEGRKICEAALAVAPDDPTLHGHLAALKLLAADLEGAAVAQRRELELLPSSAQAWLRLGMILSRQQKLEGAVGAFQRATELDPGDVMHRQNLAQALWQLGRRDEAMTQLHQALKFQPNFSLGWISLGQLLEESGRQTEAEQCYQRALACRAFRTSDLLAIARFCRSRGWHEAALTNFNQAITLNPQDAKLRLETGQSLLALKRYTEATRLFEEAVQITPDLAAAHQLYGSALGQQGKPAEAEQQFREALRLAPDLLEARLNLGIALLSQGRSVEALARLEEVLQRSPTNELALRYIRLLRAKPGVESPR